jgi:hypothetical protein
MKTLATINTPHGKGTIEEIYVSELGFLMIRVNLGKRWMSFNLGQHDLNNNVFTKVLDKK